MEKPSYKFQMFLNKVDILLDKCKVYWSIYWECLKKYSNLAWISIYIIVIVQMLVFFILPLMLNSAYTGLEMAKFNIETQKDLELMKYKTRQEIIFNKVQYFCTDYKSSISEKLDCVRVFKKEFNSIGDN